ncbi:MAG: biotin--[acetyl-CoA-carboxylase] ligase [Deltaproteobacteria bacterium]|nr:biotin--[acetyl-CoA-carboxylase] ligase [Deltaproteobacteria bacterium]
MNLNQRTLEERLAGQFIGHRIRYYEEIGSTNDEAFRLGAAGAPEGTALIADTQRAGRGRMQRVWHSPAGANIYTSVILRPEFEAARAPQISIAAGVAAAETLCRYCPDQVQLKWPNDVLINGKKGCGILAQMKMTAAAIDFVVVGIGINVNLQREQFPSDLREMATSLAIETGREISRLDVIIRLYENTAKWYRELVQTGFGAVRKRWLDLAPMIGKSVLVRYGEETVNGEAAGIDDDGSLILRTAGGKTLRVSAGDATILKR